MPKGNRWPCCALIKKAGYSPSELDFIEGHGTGTTIGDKTELEGITKAMEATGNTLGRSCGMTSFKSIVGHTKAAAGIGAFIKAVIAANRRVIPPTAGCAQPNKVFEDTARNLYPLIHGEASESSKKLRIGVSAMGFGGINSHVTLESGDVPAEKFSPSKNERALLVSNQESEVFVLDAESSEGLQRKLIDLAKTVEPLSLGDMTDLAADLGANVSRDLPFRAAVIANRPDKLSEKLRKLDNMLREKKLNEGALLIGSENDIWAGNTVKGHRLGFLLPGQGSHQVGMGQWLIERYEWAKDLATRFDLISKEEIGTAISKYMRISSAYLVDKTELKRMRLALADTKIAQAAICLTSLLYARLLSNLGISPTVVAGHSLGELTAFHLAGGFDEDALIRLAILRGDVMSSSRNLSGSMASIAASQKRRGKVYKECEWLRSYSKY